MGTAEQALLGYLRWAGAEAGQIDQRGDRAADDIPVARSKRDYRLNIEHVRRGVVLRTDPAIDVVLKWQAVHCRDRVLRSDGEILHRLLGRAHRRRDLVSIPGRARCRWPSARARGPIAGLVRNGKSPR